MLVPDNLPGGANAYVKLLFLLRLEEAHVPEPDIQFRRHEPVRFLQSEFPLEIDFRAFIHVEDNRGSVAADVFAEPSDKALRALQRFFAGNLKIDGGFGESTEEIFAGEHCTEDSKNCPKQQRAFIGTRQTVTGHQCLPERMGADSSLYRYVWQVRKFRGHQSADLLILRFVAAPKNVRSRNDIKWMVFTAAKAHSKNAMILNTAVP